MRNCVECGGPHQRRSCRCEKCARERLKKIRRDWMRNADPEKIKRWGENKKRPSREQRMARWKREKERMANDPKFRERVRERSRRSALKWRNANIEYARSRTLQWRANNLDIARENARKFQNEKRRKKLMNALQKLSTNMGTPAGRLAALRAAVDDSIKAMARAAEIFSEMEAHHDPIDDVPQGLVRILRKINSGQMLPEIAARFDGRLRMRLGQLPTTVQRKLLGGETIPVKTLVGIRLLTAEQIEPKYVDQVFGDGFIRPPEQQEVFQETERQSRVVPTVDHEKKGVIFAGKWISKKQLQQWLKELEK